MRLIPFLEGGPSPVKALVALCVKLWVGSKKGLVYGLPVVLLANPLSLWASSCPELLNKTFPRLQDDQPESLCRYQGKVILVVNTASYCGFTSQYEDLERLHSKFQDKGFVVLGFPSNDFGNQEPGSNEQIAEFCTNTFGVKFPMFAKSHVRGAQANPLFLDLSRLSDVPSWNFHKYLIDRQGKLVRSYSSAVKPSNRLIVGDIERALGGVRPQSLY